MAQDYRLVLGWASPLTFIASRPLTIAQEVAEAADAVGHALEDGEAGVQVWISAGRLVPARYLKIRWGLGPDGLDPGFGDAGLPAQGELWYPTGMQRLRWAVVQQVQQSLGRLDRRLQLAFWTRRHVALNGLSVVDACTTRRLDLVCALARKWNIIGRPSASTPAS
jgi:hypothetical protein